MTDDVWVADTVAGRQYQANVTWYRSSVTTPAADVVCDGSTAAFSGNTTFTGAAGEVISQVAGEMLPIEIQIAQDTITAINHEQARRDTDPDLVMRGGETDRPLRRDTVDADGGIAPAGSTSGSTTGRAGSLRASLNRFHGVAMPND